MTSRDFCYWLQGFFEIGGDGNGLTPAQANTVRKHLALVFVHEIDPSFGGPEKQAELNKVHSDGGPLAKNPLGGGGHGGGPLIRC